MEFGICLLTKAQSWAVAQRAEELGFTYAWFYDTQLLSADVLVAMGAAAMKTSRIKLCAGVLIPSNRIAPVAANALATLNALAPGRVVFGVSTGYTGRRTMGLGPVPLARLEKYVDVVDGLLKGKTVDWSEEGGNPQNSVFESRPWIDKHRRPNTDICVRLRPESSSPHRQAGRGVDRRRQLSTARVGRH